ncbi:translation initiation factor eIF-1A [Candidatus Woesearchaeota archaeon]|nr:translation initiation factor eIF-1A [Candidatus Woesearchaeota archaeon]
MGRKEEELAAQQKQELEIRRIRIPKGKQTFGLVTRKLGASRVEVKCFDGRTRVCRIPGRLKRFLWLKPGAIVIVEPWEFSGDEKGDVIFKYTPTQVGWLKQKGHLKQLETFEEI